MLRAAIGCRLSFLRGAPDKGTGISIIVGDDDEVPSRVALPGCSAPTSPPSRLALVNPQ
jgi:hypothetical protein